VDLLMFIFTCCTRVVYSQKMFILHLNLFRLCMSVCLVSIYIYIYIYLGYFPAPLWPRQHRREIGKAQECTLASHSTTRITEDNRSEGAYNRDDIHIRYGTSPPVVFFKLC
jgi:hypothetical protein